jgi:uncharacterized protein
LKLHLDQAPGKNIIVAHEPGQINVNGVTYTEPILVPTQGAIETLAGLTFESVGAEHFVRILAMKPDVVLLGTGARQRFVHPKVTAPLNNRQIGVDAMTTGAACRTFTILVGEGRECIALLFP